MSFIEILADESKPFDWQFIDGAGKSFETVFTLKMLDDETEAKLKAKHKKTVFINHQPHTQYADGYTDDILDTVIVGWSKLYARKASGDKVEVPCERQYKLALPDRVRAKIIEITVGKEAAMSEGLLDSKSTGS